MDANLTNIEGLTEAELRDLLRNAEKLLSARVAERARATLKEARRMAAEVGFEATFTKIPKSAPGAAPAKVTTPRGPARQKYRNPNNPAETWAGRGRPPKWVQAALEVGQTLEDLAIPAAAAEPTAA
jgi:DNA-binding protein H-NS